MSLLSDRINTKIEILRDNNNQQWFKQSSCGKIPGIKNISNAVASNVAPEDKKYRAEISIRLIQ